MVIFHSYVKLPEGKHKIWCWCVRNPSSKACWWSVYEYVWIRFGHVSNLGSKNTRWCTVLRHLSNRFCPENHVVPTPISTRHFSRPLWGPILFQPIWPRPVWSTHHQGLRTSLHFHLSNLVYTCLYLLWLFALIYIYLHAFASIIVIYIKHVYVDVHLFFHLFTFTYMYIVYALIYMYYLSS